MADKAIAAVRNQAFGEPTSLLSLRVTLCHSMSRLITPCRSLSALSHRLLPIYAEASGWLAMLLGSRPVSDFSKTGDSDRVHSSDFDIKMLLLQTLVAGPLDSSVTVVDDGLLPGSLAVSETGIQPVLPVDAEVAEMVMPAYAATTVALLELDDDAVVTVGAMKQLLQPLQQQLLELTQQMEAAKRPRANRLSSKSCCIM